MLVDFCLPVKNEEKILPATLERLLAYCQQAKFPFTWRIIGVVNGSTDSSSLIFQEFKRRFPGSVDYLDITEAGRGRALKKYWHLSSADVVSYMDCDLAVDLDCLLALIEPLVKGDSDLVIGSRLLGKSNTQRSYQREIISRIYNSFSRLVLRHQISDLQCGFKAINKKVFQSLEPIFQKPHSYYDNNWFFDTELVALANCRGYRIKEIPVDWSENRYQKRNSKVKIVKDVWLFIINIIILKRYLRRLS